MINQFKNHNTPWISECTCVRVCVQEHKENIAQRRERVCVRARVCVCVCLCACVCVCVCMSGAPAALSLLASPALSPHLKRSVSYLYPLGLGS